MADSSPTMRRRTILAKNEGRASVARNDTLTANEELVSLPDGRRVSIASHGDLRGRLLFVFHGTPESRLGFEYTDAPPRSGG